MVQRLKVLNQEILKNVGGNNQRSGKYVESMIRKVTTKYLGIRLAVDLRKKR